MYAAPVFRASSVEAEMVAGAVPLRRRLSLESSLPGDFSTGVRHYHMHEHHYHVWDDHGCCGGSPRWQAPWPHWQPRHSRRAKHAPHGSGAWAPPWVFDEAPWGEKAGRFSLAGGLLFLLAMVLRRGLVWLMRAHSPKRPMLE